MGTNVGTEETKGKTCQISVFTWKRERRTERNDVEDLVLVTEHVGGKVREVVHPLQNRVGLRALVSSGNLEEDMPERAAFTFVQRAVSTGTREHLLVNRLVQLRALQVAQEGLHELPRRDLVVVVVRPDLSLADAMVKLFPRVREYLARVHKRQRHRQVRDLRHLARRLARVDVLLLREQRIDGFTRVQHDDRLAEHLVRRERAPCQSRSSSVSYCASESSANISN